MAGCTSAQSNTAIKSFRLSARARQFSSFMLVIGTMAGPNKLDPKDAVILQNKDEVLIPLLLESRQQRNLRMPLSRCHRNSNDLQSRSVECDWSHPFFGIAVIQIKPQLEALLGLPEDSLAKEIKLTEDLMELFVEHQIPSDLLSYDEVIESSVSASEKVETVRRNIMAGVDVIEGTKEKQLEEKTMKADMAVASAAKEFDEEPEYDRLMPLELIAEETDRVRFKSTFPLMLEPEEVII